MTTTHRRDVLRAVVAGTGAVALQACSPDPAPAPAPAPATTSDRSAAPRVLLVFFSRAGENYHRGGRADLEVGNTAVLAGLVRDRTGCDVHEVLAADPYPDGYDATVARNVEEQDDDARPAISGDLPDPASYDVVLLASPVWNVRPPMIMQSVTDALDLSGKTVHPLVTYAVSGLGDAAQVYAEACPGAMLGAGLAVRGEEVADAGPEVDRWLASAGLVTS